MSASNAGRVAVVGSSGSGKSSYVKRLIAKQKRVVIFDPMDEYHASGAIRCTKISEVQKAMRANFNNFKIAFVPRPEVEPKELHRLSHLCLAAQAPFKGKKNAPLLFMVVEEMNLCFPLRGAEGKARAFAEICSRGRHSFIHVVGVTQRFAEVSTRFRGNLTECVVFCVNSTDYRSASEASSAPIGRIAKLKKLYYLRSFQGEITEGQIKF